MNITIRIYDYLPSALVQAIAPDQVGSNRIRSFIFDGKSGSDLFYVTALADGHPVGWLDCLQNEEEPALWYYGDLFVRSDFRRQGIASAMVRAAADEARERGARTLRCYVKPENMPSLALQRSLGFAERPWQPFALLDNSGQVMFERELPSIYTVVPYADLDVPAFIMKLHRQCEQALHDRRITLPEWREIMAQPDPDEAHFFVCRGCVPVAWLKLNGLCGTGTGWISTLAVGERWRRQGAGRCAVEFAIRHLRELGFREARVVTTGDNAAAQALYLVCGFAVIERSEYRTGDGDLQEKIVFSQRLEG